MQARNDGIWGRVEWTRRGARYITEKEYRYMSPVIAVSKKSSRVLELLDMALTNTPRINDFPPITNKTGGEEVKEFWLKVKALLGLADGDGETEALTAIETLVNSVKELKAGLSELVGLDGSKDHTAKDLIQAMKAKLADDDGGGDGNAVLVLNKVAGLLDLPDGASSAQIEGAIKGLKAGSGQAVDLAKELGDIKAELALNKATDAVAEGMKAGKLAPAQKDWALEYAKSNLEGFQAYLKAAPKVVPVGYNLPPGTRATGGEAGDQSPEQAMMCKQLGLTADDVKKYGPANQEVQ